MGSGYRSLLRRTRRLLPAPRKCCCRRSCSRRHRHTSSCGCFKLIAVGGTRGNGMWPTRNRCRFVAEYSRIRERLHILRSSHIVAVGFVKKRFLVRRPQGFCSLRVGSIALAPYTCSFHTTTQVTRLFTLFRLGSFRRQLPPCVTHLLLLSRNSSLFNKRNLKTETTLRGA